MIGFLFAFLAAGAVLPAADAQPPGPRRDVCELIEPGEIRAVQDVPVKELKASEQNVRGLHFAQCVFATTDFARSVSLTLIRGTAASSGATARGYWADTFHPRQKAIAGTPARPPKKKEPPRPIPGAGDEAFWTGDARAGALYVLSDEVVLRISVGGVSDEEERIRRSEALVRAAVNRLRKD